MTDKQIVDAENLYWKIINSTNPNHEIDMIDDMVVLRLIMKKFIRETKYTEMMTGRQ